MTAGPTPAAATRSLRAILQQAVSCVSPGVLVSDSGAITNEFRITSRLSQSTGGHSVLIVRHRFGLVLDASRGSRAAWQAQALGYLYTLEDADGREIVAYHWHPTGRSHVTEQHLHLGAGAGALRAELVKAHFATGMVTLVALLRLVIEQFGVRPRRSDWRGVLARAQAAMGMA